MFESLSTRLQDVFKTLRGESRLTPENIEVALREIRLALLEADVNFKVVKAFVARAKGAVAEAATLGFDAVIVDTAGRLHIDDELMDELVAIKNVTEPSDLLFVADAMTGQDAIKSAGEFNARVGVTGVVLTKMDGDARGGAGLSVVSVVGVPIPFAGGGATLDALQPFPPASGG